MSSTAHLVHHLKYYSAIFMATLNLPELLYTGSTHEKEITDHSGSV